MCRICEVVLSCFMFHVPLFLRKAIITFEALFCKLITYMGFGIGNESKNEWHKANLREETRVLAGVEFG